jgi:hypothetical protein
MRLIRKRNASVTFGTGCILTDGNTGAIRAAVGIRMGALYPVVHTPGVGWSSSEH